MSSSKPSLPPPPANLIIQTNSDFIHDYFDIPPKYDKYEAINAKNLTEEECLTIQAQTEILLSNQINTLSPKKLTLYLEIINRNYPYRKKFICRDWIRGFCIFTKEDCLHAHGIDNLKYEKNDIINDARQHYMTIDDKQIVSNLLYVHLYEFTQLYYLPETCQNTEFSLASIQENLASRILIREHARTKLFEDFFLLIRKTYPEQYVIEDFMQQEFERIGIAGDSLKKIFKCLQKNLCYVSKPQKVFEKDEFILVIRDNRLSIHQYFKEKIIAAITDLSQEGKELTETIIKMKINFFKENQFKPSFDFYLTKENMCFYSYFKFYSLLDPSFLRRLEDIIKRRNQELFASPASNAIQVEKQLEENQKTKSYRTEEDSQNDSLNPLLFSQQSSSLLGSIQFNCCQENSIYTEKINKLREKQLALKFRTQKRKLCRHWLKGNCLFENFECQFAHGIRDLIYEKYDENIEDPEYLEFVYQKNLKLESSYISLFKEQQFLIEKGIIHTQLTRYELFDQKDVRTIYRAKMQEDAMEEFLELIWKYYGKDTVLSYPFIETEFRRVGFFKVEYVLKPQIIIDILTKKKCFLQSIVCPPLMKEICVLTPFPTYQIVLEDLTPKVLSAFLLKYQQEISRNLEQEESQRAAGKESSEDEERVEKQSREIKYLGEEEDCLKFTVNEYEIKKIFYKDSNTTKRIPPIHVVCKHFNKQLHEIIWEIVAQETFKKLIRESIPDLDASQMQKMIVLDSDFEFIAIKTQEVIQKKFKKLIFPFGKLFSEVFQEFRDAIRASSGVNKFKDSLNDLLKDKFHCELLNLGGNGHYIMQTKAIEDRIKHVSSLQKQKNKTLKLDQEEKRMNDLHYLKLYASDEFTFSSSTRELSHRIKLIDSLGGIKEAVETLKRAQFLGVDLEGNLSEKGKIELIQISYFNFEAKEAEIFVFDFLALESSDEAMESAKLAIKDIMENKEIIKILQGCQKDSLALFHLLGSKIKGGIDTQIVHNYILQLNQIAIFKSGQKNSKQKVQDFKYYSSGLNAILQQYDAPNGINQLKAKFHQIFEDKEHDITLKRPIDQEYLHYSSKDVEDLIPVYFLMIKRSFLLLRQIFKEIDLSLVGELLQSVSQAHCKYKVK